MTKKATSRKIANESAKKLTKKKLEKIKNTARDNVAQSDFLAIQEKEIKAVNDKLEENMAEIEANMDKLKLLAKIKKLQQRNEILQVKYRTKYMEAEHVRKQWRNSKDKLLDIITELKTELIKYAPNDSVIEVASRISEITNENNVGRLRSL